MMMMMMMMRMKRNIHDSYRIGEKMIFDSNLKICTHTQTLLECSRQSMSATDPTLSSLIPPSVPPRYRRISDFGSGVVPFLGTSFSPPSLLSFMSTTSPYTAAARVSPPPNPPSFNLPSLRKNRKSENSVQTATQSCALPSSAQQPSQQAYDYIFSTATPVSSKDCG